MSEDIELMSGEHLDLLAKWNRTGEVKPAEVDMLINDVRAAHKLKQRVEELEAGIKERDNICDPTNDRRSIE